MEGIINCFFKKIQYVPQDVPNSIKLFFFPYALAKVELSIIKLGPKGSTSMLLGYVECF
jgi:hypothetical protein